ncbi:hypothetical protein H4582DRAFT_2130434 [Lactarius indigo]|nr:hypothetical protein H4582DRAFT_2130434 [Lactarius indigo]
MVRGNRNPDFSNHWIGLVGCFHAANPPPLPPGTQALVIQDVQLPFHPLQPLNHGGYDAYMRVETGPKYLPFDLATLPIWRGDSLLRRLPQFPRAYISFSCAPFPSRLNPVSKSANAPSPIKSFTPVSPVTPLTPRTLCAWTSPCTPNIRSRCTFAGSDVEALDPTLEFEQTGAWGGNDTACGGPHGRWFGGQYVAGDRCSFGSCRLVGGVRVGVINIGETATVHVGKTEPWGF